jgi:hypothetical protein
VQPVGPIIDGHADRHVNGDCGGYGDGYPYTDHDFAADDYASAVADSNADDFAGAHGDIHADGDTLSRRWIRERSVDDGHGTGQYSKRA